MGTKRSSGMLAPALAVAAAVVAAGPGEVVAQGNPQAESLFRQGRELMQQERFAEACERFAASQRLESALGTLLNLADCRAKNGEIATAWALFVMAAERAEATPGEGRRAQAARRLADELEPRLPYLTIAVSDDVRVEGLEIYLEGEVLDPGVWSAEMPVDPGERQVEARAPGHEPWSTSVLLDEAEKYTLTLPRLESSEPDDDPSVELEVAGTGPGGGLVDAPDHGMPPMRKVAIGAGAAGAAGLAASAVFGLQARSRWNDAQEQQDDELRKQARTRAHLSTVSAIVGVAGAGAAVTLWILGKPESGPAEAALVPVINGETAGFALTGTF